MSITKEELIEILKASEARLEARIEAEVKTLEKTLEKKIAEELKPIKLVNEQINEYNLTKAALDKFKKKVVSPTM